MIKHWRIFFALSLATASRLSLGASEKFDFEILRFRAKSLSEKPYVVKPVTVPSWLQKYTYDQHREIRFDPRHATWLGLNLPFHLQYFHPGGGFTNTVQINELVGKDATHVDFSTKLFSYGTGKTGRVPTDIGFAGFRVHSQLNSKEYYDELVAFLGASYFRALGVGQHYGISARGLAVNSGEPGGEEFPAFQEFWVERPDANAKSLTIYALLDSQSMAGAYQFTIIPGPSTVMHVKAVVFCRKNPKVIGLAPLTSMYAHGENTNWSRNDYRPEVHDSDGLLVENGAGEWIWRPLDNPKSVRLSSFVDKNPRGFGLMQRDRDFGHYEDLEAFYHKRPSVWVEPVGEWGQGVVRLVEIPTTDEFSDNIVAFWVPEKLPEPGEPIEFEYRLHWMIDPEKRPPAGFVASTRTATIDGKENKEVRRIVIEFEGPALKSLPENAAVQAVVNIGKGAKQQGSTVVHKNSITGAWRVIFEVKPELLGRDVELRCFLRKDQHVLSETWSYLWNP
ncbi:glucan biosynthesis protein [Oleiharenicola lentus]|uniref:glucan biosynthesis protein n=1 Tax=Oleiharenicola lentus TaxID=2508720 RepID=UPI003F66EA34